MRDPAGARLSRARKQIAKRRFAQSSVSGTMTMSPRVACARLTCKDAEVKSAMAKQDNVIDVMTPEATAQFLKTEQERYARLVKNAGIKLD